GHATADAQLTTPVPLHVVTPVSGSISGSVDPSSQTVGGNSGTHRSPTSMVNGPQIASSVFCVAGSQRPFVSTVPSAHSSALQPLAVSEVRRLSRMTWFRIGTLP